MGLYIHEKQIYTKLNAQSLITENIESIFVKISHPLGDIFVGVIYHPPGGNLNIFNSELSSIMSSFRESEKIFIMGDFNINLFHNNASVKLFEETFICFNPVISTATHCKPNCHKSCIDNTFVKNDEGVPKNGTIETDISHHKSLFLISEVNKIESRKDDGRITISHCYSLDNLDRLNKIFSAKLMNDSPSNISDFVGLVQNSIDESCKLKKEKITKRNVQNNPWISMGLINSIAKRDRSYFKWKKKQSAKAVNREI